MFSCNKLNHIICAKQHVTMTDSNYQQVFNYFRHCYFLTQSLTSEDRRDYLEKMNDLLQETWYDFIWRSDLSTEVLVSMQSAKENLLRQSFEEIALYTKQVSGTNDYYSISNWAIMSAATMLAIAFIIISIIVKFAISKKTKNSSCCEQYTSEIDVRRMNLEPPEISSSSAEESHIVYYETHIIKNIGDNHECSIPSQIHIKMCCSHENCRKNPEIIMQRCKTHEKTSKAEWCRNPFGSSYNADCQKNFSSKILNFFKGNLCQGCKEPNSPCVTSSGVSMSDEFIPVFDKVRQMRLGNKKEKCRDSSKTETYKSTTSLNTD